MGLLPTDSSYARDEYTALTPHYFWPGRDSDGSTKSIGMKYWTGMAIGSTIATSDNPEYAPKPRRRLMAAGGKVLNCLKCAIPVEVKIKTSHTYCPSCKKEVKREGWRKAEAKRKASGHYRKSKKKPLV